MKVKRRTDLVVDDAFLVSGEAGEQGERGTNGANGQDGVNGKPGVDGVDGQGFRWRGSWKRGTYQAYDTVEHEGSTYVATKATNKEPPHPSWDLMSARGERGEDGISQRGPRGRDGTNTVVSGGGGDSSPAIFDSAALKGTPVFVSGDGHVDLAEADTLATAAVIGLSASDVGEGFAGLVKTSGTIERDDWTSVLGSEFLTPGLAVYLAVGGSLSHSAPEPAAGVCVTLIGRALNATTVVVEIADPVVLVEPEE